MYVLIFVLIFKYENAPSMTSQSTEFRDLPSCQAAATEMQKQIHQKASAFNPIYVEEIVLMCAKKEQSK